MAKKKVCGKDEKREYVLYQMGEVERQPGLWEDVKCDCGEKMLRVFVLRREKRNTVVIMVCAKCGAVYSICEVGRKRGGVEEVICGKCKTIRDVYDKVVDLNKQEGE